MEEVIITVCNEIDFVDIDIDSLVQYINNELEVN